MTSTVTTARAWHLLTAVVATGAVAFQLILVVQGGTVLDESDPPGLAERLVRFIGYFTILTNILVAYVAWTLAAGRDSGSRAWRVLRLDAVVGIAVTGVVHWLLLRPILDLDGADYAADKLLHVVVPVLAVAGWVAFGPRRRVGSADLLPSLAFPVLWLAYTLVRGALTDFYPYPFVDAGDLGYAPVAVNCLGVAALFLGLGGLALVLDRRLARRTA